MAIAVARTFFAGVAAGAAAAPGAAAPPESASAVTGTAPVNAARALAASTPSTAGDVLSAVRILLGRLRGELTGSRWHSRAALRPCRADSPQRIQRIRIGSPARPDLSRGGSALRGSIQSAPARLRVGAQDSGRRASTSLNRRSPVESPALASSPTISAADASSSAPPGGCTAPLVRSAPSHSKPCRGTALLDAAAAAPRAEPARERWEPPGLRAPACAPRAPVLAELFAGEFREPATPAGADPPALLREADGRPLELSGLAVEGPPAALASRAAARRGVDRCGRVRGRLDRTPDRSHAPSACWSLGSVGPLTPTSLLKRVASGSESPRKIAGTR